MEIKLNLTLDELNAVISVMGMLPFNQSHGIINKLREQAILQVQAAEAAAKAQTEASNEPAESEGGDAA